MLIVFLAALICTFHGAASENPAGVIVGTGQTVGYGELQEEWRGEIVQLSWTPRAFYLKGFLSHEECDFLRQEAEPLMLDSKVVDVATGASVANRARTSTSTYFDKGENDVVKRIEKRVAQVTMLPVANQEELLILHYKEGQKYDKHHDYFFDDVNAAAKMGGQRVVTVLMYLSTPKEGGETTFPKADTNTSGAEWSACASAGGLAVKPFKGDAVMFYGLHPDGTTDDSSMHSGCPVLKGDKWSATKWIRTGKFRRPDAVASSGPEREDWEGTVECPDKAEDCAAWAFTGECTKNVQFMESSCRKSCKLCTA